MLIEAVIVLTRVDFEVDHEGTESCARAFETGNGTPDQVVDAARPEHAP
jgi:hypothetical protein